VSRTLSGVKEDLGDVEQAAEEAGQEGAEGLDRMGDAATETSSEVERASDRISQASSSMNRMGGASNNASELLFTAGDAAQDARYGFQGLGNNIGMAAEQASIMVRQAGSTSAAMTALRSAIIGPAGAVLAIQSLIALGPEIMDFFEGSEEATARWKEELEDAAGDMFQIREEVESFEAATLDQARDVREQLKDERDNIKSTIADLENLEEQAVAEQRAGRDRGAVTQELREQLGLQNASVETIRDRLEAEEERLKVTKQAVETVTSEIGSLEAAKRLSDAYRQTTAERADEEGEAADSLKKQVRQMEELKAASLDLATNIGERIKQARQEYERGQEIQRSINIREQQDGPGPLEGQIGPDQIRAPQLSVEAEDFRTDSVKEINSAIGVLQRRMDSVDSSNLQAQMQQAIGHLRGMRKELMLAKGEAINLGPALQQGLSTLITSVARTAARGGNIAKTVLTTLADLAQRIGQMMIAFGTAALSLETLISNPIAAIGAGAALVALGAAAKSAISSEMSAATSGGGPSTPTREGGGRATGELDVPGFRSGVDNFEGGLAEVHRGEIVAMPPGSNVLTNENADAIRGMMSVLGSQSQPGGAQTVQGEMNGRLDLNVSGPDNFTIVEEINRLRSKLEGST